jgi:hypothetical protein
VAGPVAGVMLTLALDNRGLRLIKLENPSPGPCLHLAQVMISIGIDVGAPDEMFEPVCGLFLQYVPAYNDISGKHI